MNSPSLRQGLYTVTAWRGAAALYTRTGLLCADATALAGKLALGGWECRIIHEASGAVLEVAA
jgi:hypothetical protein